MSNKDFIKHPTKHSESTWNHVVREMERVDRLDLRCEQWENLNQEANTQIIDLNRQLAEHRHEAIALQGQLDKQEHDDQTRSRTIRVCTLIMGIMTGIGYFAERQRALGGDVLPVAICFGICAVCLLVIMFLEFSFVRKQVRVRPTSSTHIAEQVRDGFGQSDQKE